MSAGVGSAVLEALVPDGPMHPGDAIWALIAGLLVAAAGRSRSTRWMVSVPIAFALVVALRRGNELFDGYLDRADRALVVGVTVVALAILTRRPMPVRMALVAAIAASVGVWAVVPDTEIPLMTGTFLVGAGIGAPRAFSSRFGSALLILPLMAAVAGSAGRPARLGPAVMLGTVGAVLVSLTMVVAKEGLRRQRAGTPTTVAPGATSTVTTAPAPTTAP